MSVRQDHIVDVTPVKENDDSMCSVDLEDDVDHIRNPEVSRSAESSILEQD
jgi:hypothetical protein